MWSIPVRIFRDVYFPRFPSGLRPAGEIHGVPKQTVTRHTVANYSSHDLATVDPNGDFLRRSSNSFEQIVDVRDSRHSRHVECVSVTGGSFRVGAGRARSGRRTGLFLRVIECERSPCRSVPSNAIEKSSRKWRNDWTDSILPRVIFLSFPSVPECSSDLLKMAQLVQTFLLY